MFLGISQRSSCSGGLAIMKKWEIVLGWRNQLKEWGEYDNSLGGTIAELFAVEELGMEKAPAGEKAIDGWIMNRRVQVKAKDSRKIYRNKDTKHYVQIKIEHKELIDDILLIFVTDEGLDERYLFEIKKVEPKKTSDGKYLRYVLRDIKFSLNGANSAA